MPKKLESWQLRADNKRRMTEIDNPKYRGLRGTEAGKHGLVRVILSNGQTPEELTREQELVEQDYTLDCPFGPAGKKGQVGWMGGIEPWD